MASIPVDSSEPASPVQQSSFFDSIQSTSRRTAVLEKSGSSPSSVVTQSVTPGDTTQVPSGDAVFNFVEEQRVTATAVLDFGLIAAGAVIALSLTVTGAAPGDAVAIGAPAALEGFLLWSGRVSAVDTVTIRLYNPTIGAIDPIAATWRATVFK